MSTAHSEPASASRGRTAHQPPRVDGMRHGFIGLGAMGEPMAASMVRAGLQVTVHDLRPSAMEGLAELGAHAASSAASVAEGCDVLHLMVRDDAQLDGVLLGDEGSLRGLPPGSFVVVHSTVRPETCRRLAEQAGARAVRLLDAPVAGGVWAARAGELTMMVGGEPDDVDRLRPAFSKMASTVHHVGPVGQGQVVKIINNMVAIVNRDTVRRALRLSAACGLEPERILPVLRGGSAASWALDRYEAFFELIDGSGDELANITALARKDLELAIELAERVGEHLPDAALALAAADLLFRRPV